ncbi:hypothetical protein F443_00425 [Phytophthora nicotianae P1569]|uniref:Uncharacterized protein n=1 Tax=Phytophthora nicotianae P1569 TaxID=1317065 RepID=V9G2V8_PHYNI|nr:hypothetical protein F443_00425 [Phytophthora nicotianae P1569]
MLAALSTVTGAHALSAIGAVQDTEATGMTTTDLDLIAESHSSANVKRFLRSQSDVEERLQGNNMFNLEKFKRASDDANYAKSLFPELGIHGEMKSLRMLWDYRKYLKLHPTKNDPKLFDKAKITKASTDGTYANVLFGRWKRYGLEWDDVYKTFKAMGFATDKQLSQVYKDYRAWLKIHHPSKDTELTSAQAFLFDASRIDRAKSNSALAQRLFAKWKASGLDEGPVYQKLWIMGLENDNAVYKLYTDYVLWLDKNFPLPLKSTT